MKLQPEKWSDNVGVFLADNMEVLESLETNSISLGIIDPPYGIGEDGKSNHTRDNKAKSKQYTPKDWDKEPPPPEFFIELFRVCKTLIIFGANHFIENLPEGQRNASCWIVWDKQNGKCHQADFEMAYTNIGGAARMARFRWQGMLQGNMKNKEKRIHPTQKPVALYLWILEKFAQPCPEFKVLDTNMGSGSSAIAAHLFGCSYLGVEIDQEYYDDAFERFNIKKNQLRAQFIKPKKTPAPKDSKPNTLF